jgi:hypothetical protein
LIDGICAIVGCGKVVSARHYCAAHLYKLLRYGDPLAGKTHVQHGDYTSVEYRTWITIRQRCNNPRNSAFRNYGGRGIKVCERWNLYENFIADMGRKPSATHSLDRIDNQRGYGPSNCKWATPREQQNNMRSNRIVELHGKSMTLAQAARQCGITYACAKKRLATNLDLETGRRLTSITVATRSQIEA